MEDVGERGGNRCDLGVEGRNELGEFDCGGWGVGRLRNLVGRMWFLELQKLGHDLHLRHYRTYAFHSFDPDS